MTVLRLAPGELERLPASVARRILQLARSTAEASREAREALDAPPAAPAGARAIAGASPAFNRSPPPPARASAWCSARPRSRRPASSPRKRANRDSRRKPGSRKRERARRDGRRRRADARVARRARRRARATLRPGGRARTRGSCVWSRSRCFRQTMTDSVERTAREVTEAALREAKSAERKLRARSARAASNYARLGAAANFRKKQSSAALTRARLPGRGRVLRRANSAPVVRMTKKAAAIAAKNAPPGRAGRRRVDDFLEGKKDVEENDARRPARRRSPGIAPAAPSSRSTRTARAQRCLGFEQEQRTRRGGARGPCGTRAWVAGRGARTSATSRTPGRTRGESDGFLSTDFVSDL